MIASPQICPPISFIPTLERYGFVPDLDRYVWEEVCKWTRKELDEGRPLIPVSVNISPVDIFTLDVPAIFEELVCKYRIPKKAVKVEITESAYSEGFVFKANEEFRIREFLNDTVYTDSLRKAWDL